MSRFALILAAFVTVAATASRANPVLYSLTVTTAYSSGDPFSHRLDAGFVEPYGTGYYQIANTGASTFTGTIGDIADSPFGGNLSFRSSVITLTPGETASVAIPDNSADVGGFNGPYYFYRPGVEIILIGSVAKGMTSTPVDLTVADRDIQSGVWRTDQYGLSSDSFVLQGGDPWGFADSTPYALTLASGVYTFGQPPQEVSDVPIWEPGALSLLLIGAGAIALWRRVAPHSR
jgi:hypothetical protein